MAVVPLRVNREMVAALAVVVAQRPGEKFGESSGDEPPEAGSARLAGFGIGRSGRMEGSNAAPSSTTMSSAVNTPCPRRTQNCSTTVAARAVSPPCLTTFASASSRQ